MNWANLFQWIVSNANATPVGIFSITMILLTAYAKKIWLLGK